MLQTDDEYMSADKIIRTGMIETAKIQSPVAHTPQLQRFILLNCHTHRVYNVSTIYL